VFAVINDTSRRVGLILDAELMKYDTINCHPLENTATTNIARDDLLRFIRACGHEPKIAVLGGGAPVASQLGAAACGKSPLAP
jgi:Ala-tRNA(Pro) deacylase